MEVLVFQLLDPAELTFPFQRPARFRDLESGEEVVASPRAARDDYLRRINELTAGYERELRLAGIDYCLIDTAKPLDAALLAYLSARRRVM
jgi:hypothetical protein